MVAALLVAGLALLVVRVPGVAGQAIATATPMPVPTALQASPATVAGMVPGTTMTPVPAPWLTETTTATIVASITASPVLSPSVSATATETRSGLVSLTATVTLTATATPTPAGSATTTPTETLTLTATVTSTVTMTPTPAGSATRTVTPTRLSEVAPRGLVRVRTDAGQSSLFTSLVAGWFHTCGLVSGGTAYCWGWNEYGQLGDGTSGYGTYRTAPVAVSGGLSFTALAAGQQHTCGLVAGGTAYCWGYNNYGQIGDGTSGINRTAPVAVSGGRTFTALVVGSSHTCGLATGGTAYCWGYNGLGQVGDGTIGTYSLVPVAVSGGRTYTALVAGDMHACGLATGGTAYCWGYNGLGQVGDGTTVQKLAPVAVSGGRTFTALVAGEGHTCGLVSGGTTYCWGSNAWGQIGDGTVGTYRTAPVAVSGGRTFTSLVAGALHTCGLVAGGTAYCWGYNNYGQIGDGTSGVNGDSSANRTTPVAVSGGLTFTALVAGGRHTCGLVLGGYAYCWGFNQYGQLGDETTGNIRKAPVAVSGGLTYTALVAGVFHTCGLATGGTAYCWGSNGSGQLGDGTTGTNRLAPVAAGGGGRCPRARSTRVAWIRAGRRTAGDTTGGAGLATGRAGSTGPPRKIGWSRRMSVQGG